VELNQRKKKKRAFRGRGVRGGKSTRERLYQDDNKKKRWNNGKTARKS